MAKSQAVRLQRQPEPGRAQRVGLEVTAQPSSAQLSSAQGPEQDEMGVLF